MSICAVMFHDKAYYLHKSLANNNSGTYLYFFSKDRENAIDLPEGFEIITNRKSGFPFVRKKRLT